MLNQLGFLVLFLALMLYAPGKQPFDLSLIASSYAALLGLILLQTALLKRFLGTSKEKIAVIVHLEVLLFFGYAIAEGGLMELTSYDFPKALLATLLYVGALGLFYLETHTLAAPYSTWKTVFHKAHQSLLLFFPFFIPYLLLCIGLDVFRFLPASWQSQLLNPYMAIPLSLLVLFALATFVPPFLIALWKCPPLAEGPLKTDLEALCQRARFSHGGFKTWPVLDHAITAGIVGVFGKYRSILLTQGLLNALSPQAILAVVAHEIGHSQRKHLLFLPLILAAGMLPLFILPLDTPLPFLFFLLFLAAYFRFIFGFYLRLFERQADLHGLALGIPLESMIEALDTVGTRTRTHTTPSWHHYSISERITYLTSVLHNPTLATLHHRKVRLFLFLFFGALMFVILVFSRFSW